MSSRNKHSRIALRLLPLLLASALAGCAVGPDYLRPASTLPQGYSEPSAATQANPLVEQDWWKLFKDPVLDRLVDKALVANTDIRIAVARVEQAEALAREAGAAYLPEIDAVAAGSRSRISTKTATPMPASTPVVRNARSAALTTSYELDVWGRVRRSNEAIEAGALASRYSRDAIRLTVAGLVARNYLALRAYDAQLAVTAESVASRETTLKLARTRVDAGLASPLDLYTAEGALATVQAQAAELRRQRALTEHQLAQLTATLDLKIAAGDLRQLPVPPVPPAGLPSTLVESRPDVRQAEETLVAANAGIGVAKAGYFPKFTLTGSLGSESKTMADLFGAGANTWSLGLGLFMPILDFGRTSARVDQASALEQQSLAAYQGTLQTAFKEVNDSLVNLRENATGEVAQSVRVEAAAKALKLAQLRYKSGYSGYLEVLEAERASNDSLLAYISTRQARLGAAVDLFKALGGGWKEGFAVAESGQRAP
ncbi:MAG: efflux system, outer rane lipoprotein, NodT [Rhodocyclaceae bacterium]|nr:efflux system, outer rane lipoprotein, NodT [Rhodocyclaceae bacterium]